MKPSEKIIALFVAEFPKAKGWAPLLRLEQLIDEQLKAEKPRKQSEMSDEEWVGELEKEPIFKGLNVRQEIGKCAFWCKTNKRQPTRRTITNWLMKAEKVVDLKAQGAQHATGLKPPPPPGPDGWEEWLLSSMQGMDDDTPGFGQCLAARNCQNFHMLPASIQARCRSALLSHSFSQPISEVESETKLRNA